MPRFVFDINNVETVERATDLVRDLTVDPQEITQNLAQQTVEIPFRRVSGITSSDMKRDYILILRSVEKYATIKEPHNELVHHVVGGLEWNPIHCLLEILTYDGLVIDLRMRHLDAAIYEC